MILALVNECKPTNNFAAGKPDYAAARFDPHNRKRDIDVIATLSER
jgi:hypothetical protein